MNNSSLELHRPFVEVRCGYALIFISVFLANFHHGINSWNNNSSGCRNIQYLFNHLCTRMVLQFIKISTAGEGAHVHLD